MAGVGVKLYDDKRRVFGSRHKNAHPEPTPGRGFRRLTMPAKDAYLTGGSLVPPSATWAEHID